MLRKLAIGALLALAALLAVVLTRALTLRSRQPAVGEVGLVPADAAAVAAKLARAIRIETVTHPDVERRDEAAFAAFHAFLAEAFPAAHARLEHGTVGTWSLSFAWPGSDPGLPPLLLTAHFDVVPVEPGSEARWTHPPFAGTVADGHVWGRGAMDDKAGVVMLLEAVETLLARGFSPRRTVLVFLGHDEEGAGSEGAALFAARLREQGVVPYLLLDEWMPVLRDGFPGLDQPLALVRIAEKAHLTLELSVEAAGGHSSMPPRETAVGILARAVARLEAHPMPARLEGPVRAMFDHLAPELPLGHRLLFANLWLTGPLVRRQLAASPGTDALIRTTTAPTVFRGGVKDNVLPSAARAAVNFRLLPGDTVEAVLAHVRRTIDDPRVAITPQGETYNPHPPSEIRSEAFGLLARTIREAFPEAVVAPSLLVGTSDARHYDDYCHQVYGFRPLRLAGEDLARFHGIDERVAVDDLAQGVRFFARLIENAAGE